MADNCAGYRAGLRDDEELGHIDYAGKEAGLDKMRNQVSWVHVTDTSLQVDEIAR